MSEKCLKEYANNECYLSELKYEKGKLHIRYLLSIAIGLIILSVLIATKGGNEFANQLSMGSTISSIILSAIAIFMSIAGENKMSGIQSQLTETATNLKNVTHKVSTVNAEMQEQLEEKLIKLTELSNSLNDMRQDVFDVKNKMDTTAEVLNKISFENTDIKTNNFNKNQIIDLYNYVLKRYSVGKEQINQIMEYILTISLLSSDTIGYKEVWEYFEEQNYKLENFSILWGVVMVFNSMGIRKSKDIMNELLEIASGEEKTNEVVIKKIHSQYSKSE